MYERLGVQWGSSVPAFLALACAPMPLLFRKYGRNLRDRSKLAQEAEKIMTQMRTYEGQLTKQEPLV